MYKALFELSADRAEFRLAAVLEEAAGRRSGRRRRSSELFARVRPGRDERGARTARTSRRIETHLTKRHGFALSADDLAAAREHLLRVLLGGPGPPLLDRRRIGLRRPRLRRRQLSDLRGADDADRLGGRNRAAIWRPKRTSSSLKALRGEEPDRARSSATSPGPKALRAVGPLHPRPRRRRHARSTCRTSSSICSRTGCSTTFARNVATLPVDEPEHVHPIGLDAASAIAARGIWSRRPRQRARSDPALRPRLPGRARSARTST